MGNGGAQAARQRRRRQARVSVRAWVALLCIQLQLAASQQPLAGPPGPMRAFSTSKPVEVDAWSLQRWEGLHECLWAFDR